MIEFREFFAVDFRFEMIHVFVAKSFIYDKRNDCLFETQQRVRNPQSFQNATILFISKRQSSHHIEASAIHHFKMNPAYATVNQ